jgi:hypothetical protein
LIFASKIALGPILPVDVPSLFQWADDSEEARVNESYRPLNWHRQEAFWMNAEGDPTRHFFAIPLPRGAGHHRLCPDHADRGHPPIGDDRHPHR